MKIELSAFSDEAAPDLAGQLDALKSNGIGYMDIRNIDGVNIADISVETAAKIKASMDAAGIKMWTIGSPIGKSGLDKPVEFEEERLKHIARLAKIFECDKLRVFSFFTAEYKKDRDEVMKRLRRLVSLAGECGVELYHENEKGIYGDKAERVTDILNEVTELKSIYDPANYIQCGQDIGAAMDALLSKTSHCHIKDAALATGELVPAGDGDGRIRELLLRMPRDCVLTVEPHLAVFSGYANIDDAEMKTRLRFTSNREAFDCAVTALKAVLSSAGFKAENGLWIK